MGNIPRTCEVFTIDDKVCGNPARYLAFYKEDDAWDPYRDDQPVAICETCQDTDEAILLVCWPLA